MDLVSIPGTKVDFMKDNSKMESDLAMENWLNLMVQSMKVILL